MRKITKGNVTIKLWDIGGQPRFRSMWERYCRGVNAIVWVSSWEIRNLNHNLFRFITLMISVVYRQLHGWRGRPGQNRGFPQRAPSLAGQTAAGRNTSSGAWKQKRSSQRSRWERPHRKDVGLLISPFHLCQFIKLFCYLICFFFYASRNLSAIQDREICCYSISCKEKGNIDITLQWLITHSKSGGSRWLSTSHINQPANGITT